MGHEEQHHHEDPADHADHAVGEGGHECGRGEEGRGQGHHDAAAECHVVPWRSTQSKDAS